MNDLEKFEPKLDRMQRGMVLTGAFALLLCALVGLRGPDAAQRTFQSYLFSYVFWISIPLGCMAILMMHHLTGGWWGYPIRRLLEAGTRTFLVMTALFIPMLFGNQIPILWAQWAIDKPSDPALHFKAMYLTKNLFVVRSVIYFAIWLTLAYLLNKWSYEQDRTGNTRLAVCFGGLQRPGINSVGNRGHLFRDRLGDVDRAAVVFDDLTECCSWWWRLWRPWPS